MKKLLTLSLTLILAFCSILSFSPSASAASYIVNPSSTFSYSKMVSNINQLKKAYPGLVQSKVIGTTDYGRNIYAVSLGKGDASVFINGSHHAREWITTSLTMNMIDKYAYAYQNNKKIGGYQVRKILNQTTIWFVPMVNPDGVTLQQYGLSKFPANVRNKLIKMNNGSKNFKRWKANASGIDLNRQYNAKWKAIKGPSSPSFKNYKGKKPVSEKEVKAILSLVDSTNPEMAVSYHTSGQIIYWNYQQTGARYTRDYGYAKKLRSITGYSLVYPKSFGGGGGFSDWFSRVEKKPAYTIELAPFAGETHVPLKNFSKVWSKNSTVGLYTAQEGFKLFDARLTAKSSSLTKEINTYTTKTASTLQKYCADDITSEKKLTISSALSSHYSKVSAEITKKEKKIKALSSKYQTKPAAALKKTKAYRDNAKLYMNGVKAGDSLLASADKLTADFMAGSLTNSTVTKHANLIKQTAAAKKSIAQMKYTNVRSFAYSKYSTPAKDLTDNTAFEIKRWQLLNSIESLLKEEKYAEAKTSLAQLDKLNQDSAAFKAANPARYPAYPKTEAALMERQLAAEKQLETPPAPPEEKDQE